MFNYYSKFIVFLKFLLFNIPVANIFSQLLYENYIFYTTVKHMILTDDKIKQIVPLCVEEEEGL